MSNFLWTAILVQIAMGAFDTIYHHEMTERLAWRTSQKMELKLHGVRNIIYAALFLTLGWSVPQGVWAWAIMALLGIELVITLWDFVEEDRSRALPATERVNHTLLTLNYGLILALIVPWLWAGAQQPSALAYADNGWIAWVCTFAAIGVVLSGLRDLEAALRAPRLLTTPAHELVDVLSGLGVVLVTGGTGFVGRRLVQALADTGHQVIVLSRNASAHADTFPKGQVRLVESLHDIHPATQIDAIVNLAGEPISNGLWTLKKRRKILASRLRVTRDVAGLIARLEHKPEALINGSAIGWYGLRGEEMLGEGADGTACFSRRLCYAWEKAAKRAEAYGVRVVRLRIGLVFDRDGGLLANLMLPFEFGLGGKIGDGQQYWSWIHRDDLVRLICHCIATPALKGAVNATAPHPVTNEVAAKELAKALHRPALIPLPALPLRLALGDLAKELFLGGQRVIPAAALGSGFTFHYADLDKALAQICGTKPKRPAQIILPPLRGLEGSLLR